MEEFSGLISILLEHAQRFFDFWNLQILVSLAVLGFVLSNDELITQRRVRILITLVFVMIALYCVFSLSVHQRREEALWTAIMSRAQASPAQYTTEEMAYLQSLKPTAFPIKAGALVVADLLVVVVTWFRPDFRNKEIPENPPQSRGRSSRDRSGWR